MVPPLLPPGVPIDELEGAITGRRNLDPKARKPLDGVPGDVVPVLRLQVPNVRVGQSDLNSWLRHPPNP